METYEVVDCSSADGVDQIERYLKCEDYKQQGRHCKRYEESSASPVCGRIVGRMNLNAVNWSRKYNGN